MIARPARPGPFALGLIVAVITGGLDQLSKAWILFDVMAPPRVIEIAPFFNLVLAWNKGVSFGMFNTDSTAGPWILIGVAAVIVVCLSVWLWRTDTTISALALGLIIGGAVGNVIDRLNYGAVVDFLDFHAAGYHWPAFNVADAGICVGAVLLVCESLFTKGETS